MVGREGGASVDVGMGRPLTETILHIFISSDGMYYTFKIS